MSSAEPSPEPNEGDAAAIAAAERRRRRRLAYGDAVAVALLDERGACASPILLRAIDVSPGGLCAAGDARIEPGARGVMQIVGPDGRCALIGVLAVHAATTPEGEHHTGFRFGPLPEGVRVPDFLDDQGRMVLFDARLRGTRGDGGGEGAPQAQ